MGSTDQSDPIPPLSMPNLPPFRWRCFSHPLRGRKGSAMLIKQTLASVLLLLKHSDLDYLRIYHHHAPIKDLDPETGAYPAGSAGSYDRFFITIQKGAVLEHRLPIPRIRYRNGDIRYSHAVLLDIMKAHSSYSLRFVLTVLCMSLCKHASDTRIHDRYGISISTLRRWKALFNEHSSEWISALKKADKLCSDILSSLHPFPPDPSTYLLYTGLCYMQGKWLVRRAFPSYAADPAKSP